MDTELLNGELQKLADDLENLLVSLSATEIAVSNLPSDSLNSMRSTLQVKYFFNSLLRSKYARGCEKVCFLLKTENDMTIQNFDIVFSSPITSFSSARPYVSRFPSRNSN